MTVNVTSKILTESEPFIPSGREHDNTATVGFMRRSYLESEDIPLSCLKLLNLKIQPRERGKAIIKKLSLKPRASSTALD